MPVFGASGIRSKYIRFQWFAEAEGGVDRLPKEAWDAKAGTGSGKFIWFGSDFEEAAFLGGCGLGVQGLPDSQELLTAKFAKKCAEAAEKT